VITKFLFFWIIIIIPFVTGKILEKKTLSLSEKSEKLILFNLTFLEPPILFWSIWGLKMGKDTFSLPVTGFIWIFIAIFFSTLFSKFLKFKEIKALSFRVSSALSNQGLTMGSFICFLIIGEEGLGLAAIYTLYFYPLVFLIIFPYTHFVSSKYSVGSGISFSVKSTIFTRRNIPVLAMIAALILNISGFERPEIYFPLNILLAVSISIYYFTLGTTFNYGNIAKYRIEIILISVLKFMLIPALTFLFLQIINLPENYEKVILIQSFMPAAIYSVVTSVIFRLDSKMTSTVFFVTNLIFIAFVLPFIILFFN